MTTATIDPKAILDFCSEYTAEFGIRVSEVPFTEDELLPCSYNWVDGCQTSDEALDGTCAVGISGGMNGAMELADVERALRIAKDYCGAHVALVWSDSDQKSYGQDRGEVILRDCRVVKVLA